MRGHEVGLNEGLSQVQKLGEAPYLGSLVVLPSFPGEEGAHREGDSLSTLSACLLVGLSLYFLSCLFILVLTHGIVS